MSNAGTQRALLIGISNYEADLPPLPGARNDVTLIGLLLTDRYGFDRSNIRTLVDEQATREQIFSAIRILSESAAPDDIIFIHYSGHGSQAPDTNGDEEDGFDETILPYDSRTEGIADITDDELNELIGSFRAQSVVVVLDSCHSGTGTRGGPIRVSQRWVPPDTREHLYQSVATRGSLTLPISENHVLFAAAQDFESELDGPFGPDNMRLGLFTAAMVGVLANSPRRITPRQLIAGVNSKVEALKVNAAGMPIPEPNMEAPLEKQDRPMFVFDSEAEPERPAAPSMKLTSAKQPQFRSLKSVFATKDGVFQPVLARRIATSIGKDISVASSIEVADAVVDVVAQDTFDIYGPAGVVQVASGLSKNRGNSAGTASASVPDFRFLSKVVQNAPTLADLISLDNPRSELQIQLKAAGVPDVISRKISTRTVKVSVNTKNHRLQYYEDGAKRSRTNSLQLEVLGNKDCYLTLVSVNSMGDVYLLLPNSGQELSGFLPKSLIPANNTILIPDSLRNENRAGFYFDYAPPGGVDRIIGICLSGFTAAERLRAQIATLELGGTLDTTLFKVDSRGATGVTPGQTSKNLDWAASTLSLTVGPE